MMEAEKGSVELVTACILQTGLNGCIPSWWHRADTGEARGSRTHTLTESAHPRACPTSTLIMSNLCNALQFLMRRRMFNPGYGFQIGLARCRAMPEVAVHTFGFAASMAALPTTWPISLACSASERICA